MSQESGRLKERISFLQLEVIIVLFAVCVSTGSHSMEMATGGNLVWENTVYVLVLCRLHRHLNNNRLHWTCLFSFFSLMFRSRNRMTRPSDYVNKHVTMSTNPY